MVNASRMADDSLPRRREEGKNSSQSTLLCTFPLFQGRGHALFFLLTSTLCLWSPPLLFPRCQEWPMKPFYFIFPFFPPKPPATQRAGLSKPRLPYPVPLKTDGRPKFSLTSKGIRTDMIGKNKLNSSWQDINLEISGVVAPIHNEFESELS